MKTFDHAVRLRVVAFCIVSDNAKLITQIIPQSGFKLPFIGGDGGRGPKTSYPPAEETVSALISTISMVSGQRVKRSTQVNKYLKPSEYGKGPTMSM